jgi:hypothetical protein
MFQQPIGGHLIKDRWASQFLVRWHILQATRHRQCEMQEFNKLALSSKNVLQSSRVVPQRRGCSILALYLSR